LFQTNARLVSGKRKSDKHLIIQTYRLKQQTQNQRPDRRKGGGRLTERKYHTEPTTDATKIANQLTREEYTRTEAKRVCLKAGLEQVKIELQMLTRFVRVKRDNTTTAKV
jgi:hypothetical protein